MNIKLDGPFRLAVLTLTALSCAGQTVAPQISKEFRKAALRSVEATRSVAAASLDVMIANGPGSSAADRHEKESEYAAAKLNASNLLTDAKVEAESADEKKIYQLLKAEFELAPAGSESFKEQETLGTGVARCRMEVLMAIDPDNEDLPKMKEHVGNVDCLTIKAGVDKAAAAVVGAGTR